MLDGDVSRALVLRQLRGSERIAAAMAEVDFPATKQDLIARLRDVVLDADGASVPLPDLVRGVSEARFADEAQARRAVEARWARVHQAIAAVERAERANKAD